MVHLFPEPVSLIFCDEVWQDATTQKFHVIGAFDSIRVGGIPHVVNGLGLTLALRGGRGEFQGQIACLDPTGVRAFGSSVQILKFQNPRHVVWAFFRMVNVSFRRSGIYVVQFLCENRILGERPLRVRVAGANGDV